MPRNTPLRRGLAPAGALRGRVEHGEMLRMIRHQLAAECERILPGRMRQLIHEAFEIDRVLVAVDAAPEARRHMRIAHRMVDQQIGDRVTQPRRPDIGERLSGGCRPWNVNGSLPSFSTWGEMPAKIDWPEIRMCRPVRLLSASKRAGQLALRDRMIAAVRHVFLARPDQLDRRARHLLGDQDRLPDIVVRGAAAEAAAEHHLVDIAFLERQAGGLNDRREGKLAVLGGGPDLASVRRVERGGVHRLHRRVVLVGIGVDRLDLFRGAGDRGFGVAVGVADKCRLRGSRPSSSHFAIVALETLAFSPSSQSIGSASSAVFACHQVSATTATALSPTRTTFLTPFMPAIFAASKLLSLPPKTGQSLIAALSMPGSLTSMP